MAMVILEAALGYYPLQVGSTSIDVSDEWWSEA